MTFKYRLEEKVLGPKLSDSPFGIENKAFDMSIGHMENTNTSKNNLNRVEGKLLKKVGDEIRTPINKIIESVDLLKEGKLTTEQISQLNSISNSSSNLLEIINQLLEYTKLTSGNEKFENIDFNFYSIIKDTLYLCNTLITNKDVSLQVDLDTQIPEILNGDPSKLSQILLTLLGNSIKFIDQGNIRLKIKLRKQQGINYLVDFEITESLTNIQKNEFSSNVVFPKSEETGVLDSEISLAIVKGIIEMLNGSIAKLGTLGDGAAFKFTIPYNKGKQLVIKPSLKPSTGANTSLIQKETFGISLTSILEECMGEIDLLEELIGLFKQNMLDFIGRANIYIPEGNFSRLGFAAHTVKTGLSMMKADNLYSLVDEIIICCKTNKDLPRIGKLYDQLLLAYPMLEKAIERELILLKNNRT